jgi:hypothetical protein
VLFVFYRQELRQAWKDAASDDGRDSPEP